MEKANLKFNSDGTFKILQASDFQDGPEQRYITMEYVLKCIEEYKPDLIMLTGDNKFSSTGKEKFRFMGKYYIRKTYECFMKPFGKLGIPTAVVFGNHDMDGKITRREQFEIFSKFSSSVSQAGEEQLDGCCNYNLPIMSSDGSHVAYNLWCFDSNHGVLDDKLDWYIRKENELKRENAGKPVASVVFQHHPPFQAEEAVKAAGDNLNGFMHEDVSPAGEDKGKQFDTMLENGNVKAFFFGHDHVNTFNVPYKGVDLICAPTAGFGSYGDKDTRGVRYITLKEDGSYETEMIYYYKKFCKDAFERNRFTMYSNELPTERRVKAAEKYIEDCKKRGTYSPKIKKECKIALD